MIRIAKKTPPSNMTMVASRRVWLVVSCAVPPDLGICAGTSGGGSVGIKATGLKVGMAVLVAVEVGVDVSAGAGVAV